MSEYRIGPEGNGDPETASAPRTPRVGYRLPRAARVFAEVAGLRLPVEAVDPESVEVALPEGASLGEAQTHEVRLVAPEAAVGPLEAVAQPWPAEDGAARGATLRFVGPSPYLGRLLLGLVQALAGRGLVEPSSPGDAPGGRAGMPAEIIVDPERISRLVQGFAVERSRVRLRPDDGGAVTGFVEGLSWEPSPTLKITLDGAVPPGPFDVRVAGYNSAFAFRVETAHDEGPELMLPLPERILRARTRRHRRVPAPAGAMIGFSHPASPGTRVRRPILDVSYAGLSFASHSVRDLLYPGQKILDAEVEWPGGARVRIDATVRHVSPGDDGEPEICGMALDSDVRPWLKTVNRVLYPNTLDVSDGRLWDLYIESEYLNLSGKTEADFMTLKRDFEEANRHLVEAADVGCQILYPSPEGGEGGLTMLKLYSGTWSGYHLCRRQGEPRVPVAARQILREVLLHGFEYMQRDPELRWFMCWVQVTGKFPRHMFRVLADRWSHERELAAIVPFRALEVATDHALPGVGADLEVATPAPDERLRLLAHLASARPLPYREAHDLNADHLDLRVIRGEWTAAGLHRNRRVQVARRDGRPVAFSVCDATDEGLHLFGLLDMVHLFPVQPGGETAYPALLEDARRWYQTLGKSRFVFYLEDEWPGFESLGVTDLGFADDVIIAADLVPDQLEHIWEATAPRVPQPDSLTPSQDGNR